MLPQKRFMRVFWKLSLFNYKVCDHKRQLLSESLRRNIERIRKCSCLQIAKCTEIVREFTHLSDDIEVNLAVK